VKKFKPTQLCCISFFTGKASFASCTLTSYGSNRCTDSIAVSNNGILSFDLSMTFSVAGETGLLQMVDRITILKENEVVLSIYEPVTDTVSRHWTFKGNTPTYRIAELHNVVANDRGEYVISAELIDPATGYIGTITKHTFATAQECNSPPELLNGYVANNGVIVSSIAEYTCKVGYKITGNDSLKCIQRGDDTLWDGEIPSCIQETEVMFQLQLGPITDCTCWSDSKCAKFLATVKRQISEGISNDCNCSYTPSRIMNTRLYCFQHPNYVSVRGFIQGTENYTAQQILTYMEQWYLKQPTVILTENRVLNINKNCHLHISEWNERECSPNPMPESSQCYCNGTIKDVVGP
jgi:hypothetical protein